MADIPERLLTLSQAARLEWLPRRRLGKRVAPSSLFRWARTGCRGVQLEVVRVAGSLCTTEAALLRFFQKLALAAGESPLGGGRSGSQHASDSRQLDAERI